MRSLETLGIWVVVFAWGWVTWKYFEKDYITARENGGPESARIEKITVWSVIGAALVGGVLTTMFLIWFDGG